MHLSYFRNSVCRFLFQLRFSLIYFIIVCGLHVQRIIYLYWKGTKIKRKQKKILFFFLLLFGRLLRSPCDPKCLRNCSIAQKKHTHWRTPTHTGKAIFSTCNSNKMSDSQIYCLFSANYKVCVRLNICCFFCILHSKLNAFLWTI